MAYSKALNKAVLKYDKAHYKKVGIKVPLEVFAQMQKCKRYNNNNQFLNMLILEEIEKDNIK